MQARAIKALAMALGVLIVQWVGLPLLVAAFPSRLGTGSRKYSTPDQHYYTVTEAFGIRRVELHTDPELVVFLRNLEIMRPAGAADQMRIRAADQWMIPPPHLVTERDTAITTGFGWPLPMFRSLTVNPGLGRQPGTHSIPSPRLPPPKQFGLLTIGGVGLPVSPIWSGLAINLAFWWLLAFAVLSIPLRPWLRRRKGRCPKCAYDLKGDFTPGCPECGWGRAAAQPAPSASEGTL